MAERLILMTGATGGLAQEVIARLQPTDQVLAIGRDMGKLLALYAQRPLTRCYQLDIRDDRAIAELVEAIYLEFGRIDILINNAGFGQFKDFADYDSETVREMVDVNTLATMTFCRLVGQEMAKRGQGHIVNIASMAGLIASSKSTVYSASKFAVIGYSNALRLELAEHGVAVTTVNPGPIATSFFDTADPSGDYLKKVAKFTLQPDQVADRIVAILGTKTRELNLPWTLNAAHKFYTLFPGLADWLARKVFHYK